MAANLKTTELLKAIARLTGDKGTSVNEGKRFRIRIRTRDGHDHAVHVQVDSHPREPRPYQVPQIARSLRLDRKTMLVALKSWGPNDLRAHLEQFTKDELLPKNYRR